MLTTHILLAGIEGDLLENLLNDNLYIDSLSWSVSKKSHPYPQSKFIILSSTGLGLFFLGQAHQRRLSEYYFALYHNPPVPDKVPALPESTLPLKF